MSAHCIGVFPFFSTRTVRRVDTRRSDEPSPRHSALPAGVKLAQWPKAKLGGRESRRQRRENAREFAKELVRQNISADKKKQFRLDFSLALIGIVLTILLVLIAPQSKWGTGVWLGGWPRL